MAFAANRLTRRGVIVALATLAGCAGALLACASARADPYGELTRFSVARSGLTFGELTSAFGVDPTDNDVYVGEEVPSATAEPTGKYRILRFDSSGALVAESPALNPKSKTALGLEGIAVDPAEHRVYALGLFERSEGEKVADPGEAAAGTLYALNAATLKSEVPGIGKREEEGVLANPEALKADAKAAGEALLNPRGIALDPTTHDVVMLGEVDTGTLAQTQRHIALESVSSAGALQASRYVDPAVELEPEVDSPVVTAAGDVLAARTTEESLEQIIQFPRGGGTPSVVFEFPAKRSGPASETVSPEELLEAGPEYPSKGAGLALAPEGSTGGVLWSDAEVAEQALGASELELRNGFAGALAVNLQDVAGTVTTSERGWTGGASPLADPHAKCALAEQEGDYPLLAAGSEGRLFALDAPTGQVVEFASGGEGCPHASAPAVPAIDLTGPSGQPLEVAAAGTETTFSTVVVQGNVLSGEWNFGDGSTAPTLTAREYQLAEAQHTFSAPGTYTVSETIKTDDLAAPELTVQRTVKVEKAQTIAFTSTAPENAKFEGPSYAVSATATSGLVVEFSSATPEHCSMSGATVKFIGAGTCTIDADQAGNGEWAGAEQISQSFAVAQLTQTLAFTSTAPSKATAGGPEYTVTAQGGASGQAVELTVDAASASVCSLSGTSSGSMVSFIGAGTCTIDANQKGNADYTAAPQAQQSIAVKRTQTISFNAANPANALVGATYSLQAVATSGLAVELATATASTCTVSGAAVTFVGIGTCEILANQAGNGEYEPAPQVGQLFAVAVRTPTPGPSPAPAPPPSTGVVGVLSYRVGLQSTTLTVSGAGVVIVKVRCLGTSSCTGKLTLRTLAAVKVAPGKRKAILVLASGSFALGAGQTKALALRLTASARKLVAQSHVLRARAVILAKDAAGTSHSTPAIVRLRAAKTHH